ncbi:putative quinol monooxygenase [Cohnella sp. CFH 77786]|uniref:putative quinol monooxygenase n=1 Tax=Cohnella sp. CFH 77786 TaxID=2662265 RepID=UPI002102DAFF|nr:antibiotic biosynthesis monooxygenase [Cohnella sp. CFH 77786]
MDKFGFIGKFKTVPGSKDALVGILLEAAEGAEAIEGCEQYIIHVSDEEPDAVWVTEIWRDKDSHAASLQLPETAALIGKAKPLIAGVESTRLRSLGGKGFPADG